MNVDAKDDVEICRKSLSWLYPSRLFSDDVSKKSGSALEKCGLLHASAQGNESSIDRPPNPVATTSSLQGAVEAKKSESGFVSNQMHQEFLKGKDELVFWT